MAPRHMPKRISRRMSKHTPKHMSEHMSKYTTRQALEKLDGLPDDHGVHELRVSCRLNIALSRCVLSCVTTCAQARIYTCI